MEWKGQKNEREWRQVRVRKREERKKGGGGKMKEEEKDIEDH